MGEAAAEGGRGGCCVASAVAQGGEESEGEERNHGWGARSAGESGRALARASTAAKHAARAGESAAREHAREQLYGALAHPLARPPLALAEVDLLDTVPVVLVRLVVGRVVSRLGHAAKGPRETRRMRKAFDHGMVVGAV